jgi:hypothetical protein
MGFEDFLVQLRRAPEVTLSGATGVPPPQEIAEQLGSKWPCIRRDVEAEGYLPYPMRSDELFLCFETPEALFQLLLRHTSTLPIKSLIIELRFAYCNPRAVVDPFCEVIAWLMQRYGLQCELTRDLGPRDVNGRFPELEPIEDPTHVRQALLPAIEYNRQLWVQDVASDEELPLRPEEAIEHFVWPLLDRR